MYRIVAFAGRHWLYLLAIVGALILALGIRVHNLNVYNTWWADDGGAHVAYVQTILEQHRLPTMSETYIAWHEPAYYYMLVGWIKFGQWIHLGGLKWWESFNTIVYFSFLALVWLLAKQVTKNQWLALLVTFLFSFLFVGVKLSAYVNNELLSQTLILGLIFLFLRLKLFDERKTWLVAAWSILLGVALLVKVTAVILVIAATLIWSWQCIGYRRRQCLVYVPMMLIIVVALNIPWLMHKKFVFGSMFAINPNLTAPRENIMTSGAWRYITKFNYHIFTSYPYWYSKPMSFASILLSDTFGDYYNLFNDVDRIKALPTDQKILVGNGRFTDTTLWRTMLRTNRIGAVIALIWLIGLIGDARQAFKQKEFNVEYLFFYIMFMGGWLALFYSNLRLPHPELGILKAHYIYYTYPLLAIISYKWWWQRLQKSWLRFMVLALPMAIYLVIAWPILVI